jgi:Winged helix DNA-binding domain
MADATLTTRALNRALLARQLLLERASLSVPDALSRMAGIQNQYAPNAYLRLWSCLSDFRRADLTRAYEDATVVQGTLMRGTIHAVARDDYRLFLAAIARTQREWGARVTKAPANLDRAAALRRVRAALRAGPIKRPELDALLRGEHQAVRQSIDTDLAILRVPPSGTWDRRRADLCSLADDVIGRGPNVTETVALPALVERYLAAFGPASVRDVASFLGMNASPVKAVIATLELRRFRAEDGTELLDVVDGLLPDPETPAPVRFLPTWDAVLLVHARRTQVLPEEYRPLVFHVKMPPSYPTFLVDGRVAGTWRHEDGEIRFSAFGRLRRADRTALDEEAHRLAAFHRRAGNGAGRTMPP